MYTCNGIIEVHISVDKPNEYSIEQLQELLTSGKDFNVYGSWVDPTCYLWRRGREFGGWLTKFYPKKTYQELIEELIQDRIESVNRILKGDI